MRQHDFLQSAILPISSAQCIVSAGGLFLLGKEGRHVL